MYPKDFFANEKAVQRLGTCLVIMPFDKEFDTVYSTISEVIESQKLNFTCTRADKLRGGGHTIKDMLREIAEAEIVIADLTKANPNVLYELGIVQMTKEAKNVILLSEDATPLAIPFDVRAFRYVPYERTIQGTIQDAKDLQERLAADVAAVFEKSFRFALRKGDAYKLPTPLMGPKHHVAYDFTITDKLHTDEWVKVVLKCTRHSARGSPVPRRDQVRSLKIGEPRQLRDLQWELLLESVIGDRASFRVQQRITGRERGKVTSEL